MRTSFHTLALGALLALTAAAPPQSRSEGEWRNPSNSVHVRSQRCGDAMCGVVTWASDKAKADARRGGTAELIGLQLFRKFRQVRPGVWKGSVFVPDINKTFHGTVTVVDSDTLVGKGCLIGGIGCKSQTWKRIK